MEILYIFVQLFEIQDHSPSVIFLRSHRDWRYVFLVWVMCFSYHSLLQQFQHFRIKSIYKNYLFCGKFMVVCYFFLHQQFSKIYVYHLQDFFICCDLCLLLLPSSGFLHLLWFMFTPSTIFRISSSIVIYVYSFYHLQDFFIYLICSHWAKQKWIWPAQKSSDCFCNSSNILGTLSQKSLTPLVQCYDFLLLVIFLPELSYASLIPRFSLPPEAAVAPPLTELQGGGVGGGGVCPKKGLFCPCLYRVVVLDFKNLSCCFDCFIWHHHQKVCQWLGCFHCYTTVPRLLVVHAAAGIICKRTGSCWT